MNTKLLKRLAIFLENKVEVYYRRRNKFTDYSFIPKGIFDIKEIAKKFSNYKEEDVINCYNYINEELENIHRNIGSNYRKRRI